MPTAAGTTLAESTTAAVERTLADFVTAAAGDLVRLDPAIEPVATAARSTVLGGGKRLRPTFAYWGWRGAVGAAPPPEPVLPALAALELLHAFALAHDDVMDRSPTRRGLPTAHHLLAHGHREAGLRGDPDRYGESAAILVGDLCLVWADQLMNRSELPCELLAMARGSYEWMRVEAIAGQFLDLLGDASPTWSVDQALRTVRLKTASYTVVRPLHYGAALGGVTDEAPLWQAYARYGTAVGEAFQLRDDLLGVYGEPAVTGKPVGEDLAQGKPTVLLQVARSMATGSQASELEWLLHRAEPEEFPRLAALISRTGAVAELNRMIGNRVVDAVNALDATPMHPPARAALTELAYAAAWREA
ncbi:MAG TPA: polyprenyl synthetase family protein [Micromonosporaceae bacterium]